MAFSKQWKEKWELKSLTFDELFNVMHSCGSEFTNTFIKLQQITIDDNTNLSNIDK